MNAEALFRFDKNLSKQIPSFPRKKFCLIGIDEAGRGPLAGPVVACAVALSENFFEPRLNDSKKLDASTRAELDRRLRKSSRWAFGIGQVDLIDSVNILRATHRAMHSAIRNLLHVHPDLKPDLILIDGRPIPPSGHRQVSIVKGDALSASIAAASVMAKVFRDKIMKVLSRRFPEYGFHKHKGYGTREHQEKILRFGPSPVHRKSFAPVKFLV